MNPIRLLIVDDSAVVRAQITQMFLGVPDVDVVGTAHNGIVALQRIETLNPDVVILDLEMPELDGLGTLKELKRRKTHVAVILFSALTEKGARVTIEALSLGARDYVTKPTTSGLISVTVQQAKDSLIEKVVTFGSKRKVPSGSALYPTKQLPHESEIQVVAVASSTGGPTALLKLFQELPNDFSVPLLVAQHMPPIFTRMFAERLSSVSGIQVKEGFNGAKVEPRTAWIAPGDFHMCVERQGCNTVIVINKNASENSCRPSADVLFRSVAGVFAKSTLAVVLTGMGQDGLKGAREIVEKGGEVFAQDEQSSVVWSMPGAVVNAGIASSVFSIDDMAYEIQRRIEKGLRTRKSAS